MCRTGILRRVLPLFSTALLLASCTPTISSQTLTQADLPCSTTPWRTWIDAVNCYSRHERPIWKKRGHRYFDLFELFDSQRRFLATQVDAGTLSETQYRREFHAAIQNFSAAINSRDALLSERYAKIDDDLSGLILGAAAGHYGESIYASPPLPARANENPGS